MIGRSCIPDSFLTLLFLFFFGTSERKARHLYYSDLRERVLRSECRQQEEVYFQLAAYAMQADLGDHPADDATDLKPYFEPKQYFPPWVGGFLKPKDNSISVSYILIRLCIPLYSFRL